MSDEFKKLWKARAELVEENLKRELNATNTIDEKILQAMEYSLLSG